MSRVKFFNYNLAFQEETEIAASSENAQFPASNLKDFRTTKHFRSQTGTLTASIVFDFKTAEKIDSIIFQANRKTGFEFQDVIIEANIIDSWASPMYSSSFSLNDANHEFGMCLKQFPEKEYRFWKITLTNTSGYVAMSKIFFGKSIYLENNDMILGWKHVNEDKSKSTENHQGQLFIDKVPFRRKKFSGNWKLLTVEEFEIIDDIYNQNGKHTPLWIVIDDQEQIVNDLERFSYYSYFSKDPQPTNSHYKLYDLAIEVVECI